MGKGWNRQQKGFLLSVVLVLSAAVIAHSMNSGATGKFYTYEQPVTNPGPGGSSFAYSGGGSVIESPIEPPKSCICPELDSDNVFVDFCKLATDVRMCSKQGCVLNSVDKETGEPEISECVPGYNCGCPTSVQRYVQRWDGNRLAWVGWVQCDRSGGADSCFKGSLTSSCNGASCIYDCGVDAKIVNGGGNGRYASVGCSPK